MHVAADDGMRRGGGGEAAAFRGGGGEVCGHEDSSGPGECVAGENVADFCKNVKD